MMGSKYTVISSTEDVEGGGPSTDLIDQNRSSISGSSSTGSDNNEYGYRRAVGPVSMVNDDVNGSADNDDENNDDYDDDNESFVTADYNSTTVIPSTTGPNDDDIHFVPLVGEHSTVSSRLYDNIFRATLLPDDTIKVYNIIFAENTFAIKLCKFTLFTFLSIYLMFYLVRFMGWEHDSTLTLSDVWRYEGNLIVTDAMFFFVIGRLYNQRGIDRFEWIIWCFAANIYSSFITDFRMFQHSFTLYEMHCKWPWQLWVFTLLVIPLIITIVYLHFEYAWRHKIVVQKCLEMIFSNTFLLLPLITSPYFHFHHWFAGLIIGMHANFYDVWWSRATMAWCWGCYINGIAVYGRDPVLTCAYAYFMSTTQRCPFVQCYQEALSSPTHMDQNNVTVTPMIPPDWRNCSSDAFHP